VAWLLLDNDGDDGPYLQCGLLPEAREALLA